MSSIHCDCQIRRHKFGQYLTESESIPIHYKRINLILNQIKLNKRCYSNHAWYLSDISNNQKQHTKICNLQRL